MLGATALVRRPLLRAVGMIYTFTPEVTPMIGVTHSQLWRRRRSQAAEAVRCSRAYVHIIWTFMILQSIIITPLLSHLAVTIANAGLVVSLVV